MSPSKGESLHIFIRRGEIERVKGKFNGVRNRKISSSYVALSLGVFILLASLARVALSDASPPTVRASVDQSTVNIGDVLNLKIEVSRPSEFRTQTPSFPGKLGAWTVRQVNHSVAAGSQPGWDVDIYQVQLAIYRTGDFEIPPLEVELTDSGGKIEKVTSFAIPIKVKPVLPEGDETLKDLKPQAEIPPDYKPFLLTLVAILAGIILIFQLVRHFRKGKHAEKEMAVDTRSAEETAREAIRRLLGKRLIEDGLYKNFYLEISEIIKRYLGSKLGILSLERTTGEFMGDLRNSVLPFERIELIRHFLNDCDLVKFAKYHPSEGEVKEIVEISYGIVETTEQDLVALVRGTEVLTR